MFRLIEMPIKKLTPIVIYMKTMATNAFVQLAVSFTNIYMPTKRTHYTINGIRCFAIKIFKTLGTITLRAGVCRPGVETKLTATKKSATDGN